jgi:hypothetical protein
LAFHAVYKLSDGAEVKDTWVNECLVCGLELITEAELRRVHPQAEPASAAVG